MEIKEPTVVDLKAQAYDIFAQIEQLQMRLRQINQVIAEKLKVKENDGK